MRFPRGALVFTLGFFALAAQTLLFRQFLTAFEGNELAIGIFFCSWLVWVTLGAWLARIPTPLHAHLVTRFRGAVLLYLPAFVIQYALIGNAREIAGVAPYEQFPLLAMVGVCFVANSPISVLTGAFFTWACRWAASTDSTTKPNDAGLTPAWVYMLEAIGAAAGSLWATMWLAGGVPVETVFLSTAIVLTAGGIEVNRSGSVRLAAAILLALLIYLGAGDYWSACTHQRQWGRLLPAGYQGSVTTAQAEYLYGEHDGQFTVMSWGSVCETPFTTSQGAEDAAAILPQCPGARRILVLGTDAYPLCSVLCSLTQIEQVDWFHPDPAYPGTLLDVLRQRGYAVPDNLKAYGTDARTFLRETALSYDLIILSLPDTTTLLLNRYSTAEFFATVRGALKPGGVIATRVPGGANYLASESAFLGLSMMTTLEAAFRNTALKPGASSWFFASDGDTVTASPMRLARRWQQIDGAERWYPAEGVRDFYRGGRVMQQLDAYEKARVSVPPEVLVNTDRNPRALLFGILLELRRAGFRLADALPGVLGGGTFVVAAALLVLAASRFVFLIKHGGSGVPPVFDAHLLIATTGLASMALSIVLMFFYQVRHGALFLHIGIISALVMLGAWIGSLATKWLLSRRNAESPLVLPGLLTGHLLVLGGAMAMGTDAPIAVFLAGFFLCGVFTGAYFPIGAFRLAQAGQQPDVSGAHLEAFDNFGGAFGAAVTGLVLLPFFGAVHTVALLAGFLALNIPPLLLGKRAEHVRPAAGDWFDRLARPASYAAVTIAMLALAASNILAASNAASRASRLLDDVRTLAGQDAELESATVTLADGAAFTYYREKTPEGETKGYLFDTRALADDVYGYGGPVVLAVSVDAAGIVRDYRIVQSQETPIYLDFVRPWQQQLTGKNIFEPDPFKDIDALSGATLTSNALMAGLERAGNRFAREVLGQSIAAISQDKRSARDVPGLAWLVGLSLAAIVARQRPKPWVRRAILVVSLIVCGWYLNLQYSTQQAASLATGAFPAWALAAPVFLLLAVPLLTILFGNIYCGYLCPFGATQELLEDVTRGSLTVEPTKQAWRYGRAVKYVLLFLLALLFAVYRDPAVSQADPLISIFSGMPGRFVLFMSMGIFALSLVFRRFWCRNLCPAGAFLALCNGIRIFRRLRPAIQPRKCPIGVCQGTDLDCICCDRCRHEDS
ncbi:MAG TPA: 4Fe-4S binding protein [Candidatus Hydrogenedentes bacterium]|nr:4Fe-4S binding protein [Candidatus Hydrogenedentota bacterium]